jgi:acetate kinase
MDLPVLALNVGSSSLKFGLYLVGSQGSRVLLTAADDAQGAPQQAIERIADLLRTKHLPAPAAIGHRIVHGGPGLRQHTLVDTGVMRQLEAATMFAPLHVPPALALLRCAQQCFAGSPQVACLDTTFHAGMPEVARTLPITSELRALGLERYGFHGLSCESIVRQLGTQVPARLVIAHLGHGASVTALADGRSVDTSMGLTPSGGVIMSTRCGDIDPGLLVHLAREHGFDAAQLEALVDRHSGLHGISGLSGDMRALHAAAPSNANARLAIAMFCRSVRKQVAAMAAVLGGIDLLVFTGGIGENDADVRARICEGLDWLGRHAVRAMPSAEDEQIAHHTWQLAG